MYEDEFHIRHMKLHGTFFVNVFWLQQRSQLLVLGQVRAQDSVCLYIEYGIHYAPYIMCILASAPSAQCQCARESVCVWVRVCANFVHWKPYSQNVSVYYISNMV